MRSGGFHITRFGDVPWERRIEDNWPPLVKRLHRDAVLDLSMNVVWYPRGAVEPRHVHPGTHATWVIVGGATMNGETIGPSDLVFGAGGIAHGPLTYEMGCMLFSSIHGGAFHRAVGGKDSLPATSGGQLSGLFSYRERRAVAGPKGIGAGNLRTWVVNDRVRRYGAWLSKWSAGSKSLTHVHQGGHAGFLMSGRALVGDEDLRPWDLLYAAPDHTHGPVEFLEESVIVMIGIGDVSIF